MAFRFNSFRTPLLFQRPAGLKMEMGLAGIRTKGAVTVVTTRYQVLPKHLVTKKPITTRFTAIVTVLPEKSLVSLYINTWCTPYTPIFFIYL